MHTSLLGLLLIASSTLASPAQLSPSIVQGQTCDKCSHICYYNDADVKCACPEGWYLSETDDKECVKDEDFGLCHFSDCSHGCMEDHLGEPICTCPVGMKLDVSNTQCQEIFHKPIKYRQPVFIGSDDHIRPLLAPDNDHCLRQKWDGMKEGQNLWMLSCVDYEDHAKTKFFFNEKTGLIHSLNHMGLCLSGSKDKTAMGERFVKLQNCSRFEEMQVWEYNGATGNVMVTDTFGHDAEKLCMNYQVGKRLVLGRCRLNILERGMMFGSWKFPKAKKCEDTYNVFDFAYEKSGRSQPVDPKYGYGYGRAPGMSKPYKPLVAHSDKQPKSYGGYYKKYGYGHGYGYGYGYGYGRDRVASGGAGVQPPPPEDDEKWDGTLERVHRDDIKVNFNRYHHMPNHPAGDAFDCDFNTYAASIRKGHDKLIVQFNQKTRFVPGVLRLHPHFDLDNVGIDGAHGLNKYANLTVKLYTYTIHNSAPYTYTTTDSAPIDCLLMRKPAPEGDIGHYDDGKIRPRQVLDYDCMQPTSDVPYGRKFVISNTEHLMVREVEIFGKYFFGFEDGESPSIES